MITEFITISTDDKGVQHIQVNWLPVWAFVGAIVLVFIVLKAIRLIQRYKCKSIEIDTIQIGSSSNVCLRYNYKDREVAFKIWIEIITRKIGIPIDREEDVIVEVYNSWYAFFQIARSLLEDIPPQKLKSSSNIIEITLTVLNGSIRRHLTKYQAAFRKWYSERLEDREKVREKTPQEIQRAYPLYEEIVQDILSVSRELQQYAGVLKRIAFGENKSWKERFKVRHTSK